MLAGSSMKTKKHAVSCKKLRFCTEIKSIFRFPKANDMFNRLLLAITLLSTVFSQAQKSPKRELRGAWITTHLSLDWPVRSQTPLQQQTALIGILDQHRATGMNAMYFQVRSQSDAMYPSNIEPWAAVLSASHTQGKNPGWDPLLFAATETHRRGMEFHAWINPYRAVANSDSLPKFSPLHVAKQHPEWMIVNGKEWILNPGLPAVRDYLLSVITDIVTRYDIDGIHFDDYFYPNAAFNDDAAYNADPRGFPQTTAGRADWRRDNINLLIKAVDDAIGAIKPWVKFGVSPSGIYRSSTNPAIGSATSAGALQHYSALYADSKKWLQQGWVDYLAPQLYWFIGQTGSDYGVLVPWWNNQSTNERHIYIGQAVYKVADPIQGANWANRSQIPNQMRLNRQPAYPNVYGEIGFRTVHLRNNPLNVRDSIRLNIYKKPALPPLMLWLDSTAPQPPLQLTAAKQPNNGYVLNWTAPAASNEMGKVRQYAVYRSESPVINTTDTTNLLAITNTDATTYTDNTNPLNKTFYYTVTAVNRLYAESLPSNVTDHAAPTIDCPANDTLATDATCSVALPDYTGRALATDDVTPSSAILITQYPAAGTLVSGSGETVVTLSAADASGKTAQCSFTVIKVDKTAPVVTCGGDRMVSTDAGKCTATIAVEPPTATDNCGTVNIAGIRSDGQSLSAAYPKGVTTISWTATDAAGNSASCTQTITVRDNETPVITAVSANPASLFPPNHKMKNVTVSYNVTDNCGPVVTTLSVTSNEPDNGTGDGDVAGDWQIIDNHHLKLRAERAGNGNGRIYTITITATDAAGNVSTQAVTVTVPHDHSNAITSNRSMAETMAEEVAPAHFTVKASPNPGVDHFLLTITSAESEGITLRVTDAVGRVIEARSGIAANVSLRIGSNYRPGTYYVELMQGKAKRTLTLVKRSK
jgi:uncharacterized lipoprotein YddW (UPF0748 family)